MSDPRTPDIASLRGAVDLSSLARPAQPPTPPPAGGDAPAASGVVIAATDADLQQLVELSSRVPVVIEFVAQGLEPVLGPVITSYGGRLVLAVVDGQANANLAGAFQLQRVPTVAAIVAGRPYPLYEGAVDDAQARQVFDQVLDLAAQQGVTGQVPVGDGTEPPAEVEEPPLPPLHQAAFDAIAAGDYAAAVQAYDTAIAQDPRDTDAVAGRAQAALLLRLDGADPGTLRAAAADDPADAEAQLAVADLDLSGGHVADAYGRVLDAFAAAAPADRDGIRARLLEYFEIVGTDDERTGAARRRLAALLY